MGFFRVFFVFFVAAIALFRAHGQPMVPAVNIFGDSVVDVGNNNNRLSLVKANFPPYGRDFVTHKATGRFCNGKLAIDFTADYLGFTSYPPAYLSDDAKGRNILTGVNFASAACGYYNMTSFSYLAISLPQQLENYKDWQNKVVRLVGQARANEIFSGAVHLLSAGSSDFVQNYYVNPLLRGTYSMDRFTDILMKSFTNFVEKLYGLGARRIGVTTLPPTGCLPAAITLFGRGSNQCVPRLNADAVMFNNKLNSTAERLLYQFQGLKLVIFDIYEPLLELVMKPSENGFLESRRACCGTGTIETSLLCNSMSIGTCTNASQYVFWDSFHPTELANQYLAQSMLVKGFDLIS
ncbi:GDSL esterase/lipase [Heracleum sosnowskyi]|uniref:GDSL esterase/lipase n=1 Tax=Heracleum sosnowskyi TaxID=360622 RepID=A0AAD8MWR7_9APIA|nr:GDSL esterase/lipase [Heracleum sosnowskyi]